MNVYETANRYLFNANISPESIEVLRDVLGYFDAPASAGHHLAIKGGLVQHSVNVTNWLLKLTDSIAVKWPRPESPYLVGMFHDLVKCKCYGKDDAKVNGYKYIQPEYPGHGTASALILMSQMGVVLFPAETAAICFHMGAFNLSGKELNEFDAALSMFPLEIIATHTADMLAARYDEEFDCKAIDGSEGE